MSLRARIYDKWWKEADVDEPTADMPVWTRQDTNTRSGSDTWRCKECHGWDYRGADGAYGSGSHFTGFPGVLDAREWDDEQIVQQLDGAIDPDHDFSAFLGHDEMHALAAFVIDGTFNMSGLIDADKKIVGGDVNEGLELYETYCLACHGADGKDINFGSGDDPEYVGTIAVDNPWELIHKIMFGQPGTDMPAGFVMGWDLDEIADIGTYLQTLPTK
jgi:thiosulfate dehydrogenase